MPPPSKPTRPLQESSGRDSDESSTPSNNLWVANLSPDVTDSDLMDLFVQYGALDSVTSYSARNYAFVFFKRIDDAKAAKSALQGFNFRGNNLKIEFARPVRSHFCALLIFNYNKDSCIIIIIYIFSNLHRLLLSTFSVNFVFNLPSKLLGMNSRFLIAQIKSVVYTIFRTLLNR